MVAADYPFLDVLWTMLVFFIWIAWFMILFRVLIDIFRRHDIGGGGRVNGDVERKRLARRANNRRRRRLAASQADGAEFARLVRHLPRDHLDRVDRPSPE